MDNTVKKCQCAKFNKQQAEDYMYIYINIYIYISLQPPNADRIVYRLR